MIRTIAWTNDSDYCDTADSTPSPANPEWRKMSLSRRLAMLPVDALVKLLQAAHILDKPQEQLWTLPDTSSLAVASMDVDFAEDDIIEQDQIFYVPAKRTQRVVLNITRKSRGKPTFVDETEELEL